MSGRHIGWNFRGRTTEILVFDLDKQPESFLLCVSAMFNKKQFEFSTDGHL